MSGLAEPALGAATVAARLRLARRARTVRIAKWALPAAALCLLGSIAIWPEVQRVVDRSRASLKRMALVEALGGEMKAPRYRGFDTQNQPYMISAAGARQDGQDRYRLREPRGDITLRGGTWIEVRARVGIYAQKSDQLDLSENVTLYRGDGTLLTTEAAALDMRRGAASGAAYTHAEGPFGTLDAEGFTLLDRGGIVQFHGPARLVLNEAK